MPLWAPAPSTGAGTQSVLNKCALPGSADGFGKSYLPISRHQESWLRATYPTWGSRICWKCQGADTNEGKAGGLSSADAGDRTLPLCHVATVMNGKNDLWCSLPMIQNPWSKATSLAWHGWRTRDTVMASPRIPYPQGKSPSKGAGRLGDQNQQRSMTQSSAASSGWGSSPCNPGRSLDAALQRGAGRGGDVG